MKYRNKNRKCRGKGANKNTVNPLKIINRNGSQVRKKCKRNHTAAVHEAGLTQYVFYAILNTDLHMNQGTAAANIASGLILLHSKLDNDQVKSQYIDMWTKHGRKIIILKGYDHKHLKYLHDELKFLAVGTHIVRQSWGRNRAISVLAAFGQREDMAEVFEGLSYLR
ncbi:hypothetical protein ANTPLA_LOCUS7797 [Anthophora plagiata]